MKRRVADTATLALSNKHSHSLVPSRSRSPSRSSLALALSLSRSLSLRLRHVRSLSLCLSVCLSLTRTRSKSHARACSLERSLPLSLSLPLARQQQAHRNLHSDHLVLCLHLRPRLALSSSICCGQAARTQVKHTPARDWIRLFNIAHTPNCVTAPTNCATFFSFASFFASLLFLFSFHPLSTLYFLFCMPHVTFILFFLQLFFRWGLFLASSDARLAAPATRHRRASRPCATASTAVTAAAAAHGPAALARTAHAAACLTAPATWRRRAPRPCATASTAANAAHGLVALARPAPAATRLAAQARRRRRDSRPCAERPQLLPPPRPARRRSHLQHLLMPPRRSSQAAPSGLAPTYACRGHHCCRHGARHGSARAHSTCCSAPRRSRKAAPSTLAPYSRPHAPRPMPLPPPRPARQRSRAPHLLPRASPLQKSGAVEPRAHAPRPQPLPPPRLVRSAALARPAPAATRLAAPVKRRRRASRPTRAHAPRPQQLPPPRPARRRSRAQHLLMRDSPLQSSGAVEPCAHAPRPPQLPPPHTTQQRSLAQHMLPRLAIPAKRPHRSSRHAPRPPLLPPSISIAAARSQIFRSAAKAPKVPKHAYISNSIFFSCSPTQASRYRTTPIKKGVYFFLQYATFEIKLQPPILNL